MAENSILCSAHCRLRCILYPMHFSCPLKGVKQLLDNSLLSYNKNLGGCILAYNNIKCITRAVPHIDGVPYSVFAFDVDLLLFKPKEDALIVVEVEHVSAWFANVLVKGCFSGRIDFERENEVALSPGMFVRCMVKSVFNMRGMLAFKLAYVEEVTQAEPKDEDVYGMEDD